MYINDDSFKNEMGLPTTEDNPMLWDGFSRTRCLNACGRGSADISVLSKLFHMKHRKILDARS